MDKRYLKNVLIYLLTGALSLLGIGYIVFHLSGADTVSVSTEVAILTTTETRVQAQGMILRDETPIKAQGSDVCSIVQDGVNVTSGSDVLRIFGGDQGVSQQIRALEARITVLKKSLAGTGIPTAHNSNEKELKQLYSTMMDTVHGGSLADAEKLSVQLQTRINLRKHSSVTEAAIKASIQELQGQIDALLAAQAGNITVCTAPVTGLYYLGSDGFEDVCTLQAARTMGYGDFVTLVQAVAKGRPTEGVGRIVTDTYWCVAMTLDVAEARSLRVGAQYPICFDENEGTTVMMTLERMETEYKQSDCLAVFGCRTVPKNFSFKRIQQVSVVTSSVKGIRVPASAVRYLDGKAGVYVTEGNKVVFRRIDVLCAKDGYYTVKQYDVKEEAYADMLRLHDRIVLTGKGLYHGRYLR